jgi:replication fork protection complex subunit Csm3/Swi3
MLNMYQLWLDDLYPRAKFADALSIIERVGHTKRMQVDRKAWIDEGKPRRTREDDEDDSGAPAAEQVPVQQDEEMDRLETGGDSEKTHTATDVQGSQSPVLETVETTMSEDPNEDELDALLAESALPQTVTSKVLPLHNAPTQDDPFADEMEAMADMEDMW